MNKWWWYSFWGRRRFHWLSQKQERAMIQNKNIDEVFRMVFRDIELNNKFGEKDYTVILRLLILRRSAMLKWKNSAFRSPSFRYGVFTWNTIRHMLSTLHVHSHPSAWEVAYRMTSLVLKTPHPYDADELFEQLKRMEDSQIYMETEIQEGLCSAARRLHGDDVPYKYMAYIYSRIRGHLENSLYPDLTPVSKMFLIQISNSLQDLYKEERFTT
jgi:hypothetical protein